MKVKFNLNFRILKENKQNHSKIFQKIYSYIFLVLAQLCFISFFSEAAQVYNVNQSVRALGMGNAYVAVVNDADSIFYNPAGLAQVGGISWTIFDLGLGASGAEALTKVTDLQGTETFAQTLNELYGERVWLGGGGKMSITIPHIAVAAYDYLDASLDINNPVYPNMDIAVVNDYAYAVGFGIPILPAFHLGASLKRITRTGARAPFGPSFIASLDPTSISNDLQQEGVGYAMDLGFNLKIPGPVSPTFSLMWRNLGKTTFKATEGSTAPPDDEDDMTVGMAMDIDGGLVSITPAFEFKHINRSDVQLGKKVHFGVELGLPLVDFRAGFYQGYYTLGTGISLGLVRLEAATYGVEMGEYPGQLEDRRYVVQLVLELGFDMGLNFLGEGGGTGRNSVFGGKRLKQRR